MREVFFHKYDGTTEHKIIPGPLGLAWPVFVVRITAAVGAICYGFGFLHGLMF